MRFPFALTLLLFASGTGCMKAYHEMVGGEPAKVVHRIYTTDYNTAWNAVLDALKTARFDVSNRDSGLAVTHWADNTIARNFTDSFGGTDALLKAQFRFNIQVTKGFFNGRSSVKVSVQKEQLIQRDVLEGWKPTDTEPIEENTLLYRIGRMIAIRMKLQNLEDAKTKKDLEGMKF